MSNRTKIVIGGVVVGLILLAWLPFWAVLLIIVGIPAAAYFTLDSSSDAACAGSAAVKSIAELGSPPLG